MKNVLESKSIALIHDWFPLLGGAERVVEQMTKLLPQAEIFTLFDFLKGDDRDVLNGCNITTSSLNDWPKVDKYYRSLLPLCIRQIERFDVTGYDVVLSSSAAISKGVIVSGNQVHVSYVHSPARYAWELTHQYLRTAGLNSRLKGIVAREMLHKFRIWDSRTSTGVDKFIANSRFIRNRIWRVYRREAEVIYPPVDIDRFTRCDTKEEYYLTASRMVPYKRIDLIVEVFSKRPNLRLIVVGDGPEYKSIKKLAKGNVEFVGRQPLSQLVDYMQKAKAFVFAAHEDFGIVPVEAQACGTPVIALGHGGTAETVIDVGDSPNQTGIWFHEQSIESLLSAVDRFEKIHGDFNPENCRRNAERFAPHVFREKLQASIIDAIESKQISLGG